MTLPILTNLAVCLLLIAGIALGVVLMRRLAVLRAAQGELAAMGETLVVAAAKAEAGLAELRRAAEADGQALQERVARGRALKDDLVFLVERAGEAAERLEGAIGEARKSAQVRAPAAQSMRPTPKQRPVPGQPRMAGGERSDDEQSDNGRSGDGQPGGAPANSGNRRLPPAGEQLLRALQGMR